MTALIEYGKAVTVFSTGWKAERFPVDHVPPAWWDRTDYAWRCTACPYEAGVLHRTLEVAHDDALKHAGKHTDAVVEQI